MSFLFFSSGLIIRWLTGTIMAHMHLVSGSHQPPEAPEDIQMMFHLNQILPLQNQPIRENGAGPPFIVIMFCLLYTNIVLKF